MGREETEIVMEETAPEDRIARYNDRPEDSLRSRIERQRVPASKRVVRAADRTWVNDVQRLVDAQNGFEARAVAHFLRRIPAGQASEIHRHNFEAIGYVVKGRGHEIHDGERIDWAEGDGLLIPANVWHQHVNDDAEQDAVLLLMTDWPLMLALGTCTMEAAASWEDALSRAPAIPAAKW